MKNPQFYSSTIIVLKWIWAFYQRKWYVPRLAKDEDVPTSLKNKMSKIKEPSMVVQFAVDDKYSIIPMKRLSHFVCGAG